MLRSNDCVDALRLTEAEQQRIFEQLENSGRAPPGAELRATTRYRYAVHDGLVLTVKGASASFVVRPRNISTGGVSVLHGSFLYPGSRCVLRLTTRAAAHVLMPGKIVRCRCVRGRVHEIGIAFDRSIEVDQYVDVDVAQPLPELAAQADLDHSYPGERIADLARQVERLATEGASRNVLRRLINRMTAELQDKP